MLGLSDADIWCSIRITDGIARDNFNSALGQVVSEQSKKRSDWICRCLRVDTDNIDGMYKKLEEKLLERDSQQDLMDDASYLGRNPDDESWGEYMNTFREHFESLVDSLTPPPCKEGGCDKPVIGYVEVCQQHNVCSEGHPMNNTGQCKICFKAANAAKAATEPAAPAAPEEED